MNNSLQCAYFSLSLQNSKNFENTLLMDSTAATWHKLLNVFEPILIYFNILPLTLGWVFVCLFLPELNFLLEFLLI